MTIERKELDRDESAVGRMLMTVQRLRDAGIPVVGVLGIEGVARGRLTIEQDMFDNVSYTWEEA